MKHFRRNTGMDKRVESRGGLKAGIRKEWGGGADCFHKQDENLIQET